MFKTFKQRACLFVVVVVAVVSLAAPAAKATIDPFPPAGRNQVAVAVFANAVPDPEAPGTCYGQVTLWLANVSYWDQGGFPVPTIVNGLPGVIGAGLVGASYTTVVDAPHTCVDLPGTTALVLAQKLPSGFWNLMILKAY